MKKPWQSRWVMRVTIRRSTETAMPSGFTIEPRLGATIGDIVKAEEAFNKLGDMRMEIKLVDRSHP